MKRQRIGPIDLLAGLQLQPAEGKPDGLLRALNMEDRDNLLQTRRGTAMSNVNLQAGGWVATQFSPANLAGQTVFYIGVPNLPTVADSILHVLINAPASYVDDVPVDEVVTFEYWGEDLAWHTFDVINIGYKLGVKWIDVSAAVQVGGLLNLVVPYGWKIDTPAGPPAVLAKWMRVTRTTPWTGGAAVTAVCSTPIAGGNKTNVIAAATRTARSVYAIAPAPSITRPWSLIKINDKPIFGPVYTTEDDYLNHAGINVPFDGVDSSAVYVPASDVLLASLSGVWVQVDCTKVPSDAQACALFAPLANPGGDGPYDDIPCRNAMPVFTPSFIVMFGGRVFAGGFQDSPCKLIWSAPEEFWATWPADNEAILGAGSSGKLLGAAVVGEVIYIITATGIWRGALADPTEGNESDLFVDLVEEVPCVSAKSIVPIEGGFCFLSSDGVRLFDANRNMSRVISDGVRDLFRPESEHPLACLNKQTGVGVWHRIENQYRLAYTAPGSQHNDTVLVVDLDDWTCQLWGADQVSALDSVDFGGANAPIIQRARGVRVSGWAWDELNNCLIIVDPEGVVCRSDTGYIDVCQAIPWYFESQTLRVGGGERGTLERAELSIAREHFQTINVSVVPDGDYARKDTKTIAVQSDGLDTNVAFGVASLSGSITPLQLRGSFAPLIGRFRKSGRNHRVLVEGVSPLYPPVKALSLTVDIVVDESRR